MAYIKDGKPSITTIKGFFGLNMNETGETQLKLGEASYMRNYRITKDYKLEKMYGYGELYTTGNRKPVRANWVGKLGENEVNVYVAGGKAYNKGTELGSITNAVTSIFEFNQKLYFINGTDFKSYDGTTFGNITPYIPKVKISCTPAGVGTDYEPVNLITDYRKVSFSGDGTSTQYQLPEKDITLYSNNVWIDGVVVTEGVTYNGTNGTVTFTTAPAQGVDNVLIQYKKNNVAATVAQNITKNKYAQTFGLANDTRVFLYGNSDAKNRIYFSDLADGVPDPTYYPATNFIDVGSSNTAVTDISRQYDRLIISKESETYYATYSPITDTEGNTIIAFPTYPLNKSHGMLAYGKGKLLDNFVTTIDSSGIIQWVSTNNKDERNASVISTRVAEWLNSKDVAKAVTLDYQEDKEYWLAIDKEVLVYNYGNSTFFMLEFPKNVRTLTTYKGVIYMGTETGIAKFDKGLTTYDGTIIKAEWRSGFYDFDYEYRRKTMRILWITLKPYAKTYLRINYLSDRNAGTNARELQVNSFSYPYWNYADFTYNTNNQVKPFKVKLKAKKFGFIKLYLLSDKIDSRLTVDSISIQKSYGGYVK